MYLHTCILGCVFMYVNKTYVLVMYACHVCMNVYYIFCGQPQTLYMYNVIFNHIHILHHLTALQYGKCQSFV